MAVHVVDHPLVRHKLGILRKESTSTSEFRMLAKEIARLLMYEATKQFKTEKRTIKGWAGPVEVESISGKMVTIVPILRAGLGLMDGVLDMVPGANQRRRPVPERRDAGARRVLREARQGDRPAHRHYP